MQSQSKRRVEELVPRRFVKLLRTKLFQQQNGGEILVLLDNIIQRWVFFFSLSSMAHNKVREMPNKSENATMNDLRYESTILYDYIKTRELIHASSQHYRPSKTTMLYTRLGSHASGKSKTSIS